jgi:hypothetical protein
MSHESGINCRFIANGVWTTDETVKRLMQA